MFFSNSRRLLEFVLSPNDGVGKATIVAHSKCLLKIYKLAGLPKRVLSNLYA